MRRRIQRLRGMVFGAILVLALPAVAGQQLASVAYGPPDVLVQSSDQSALPELQDTPVESSNVVVDNRGAYELSQEQQVSEAPAGTAPMGTHPTRTAPWVSSPLSGPAANPPIANFGVVEKGILYRSAQPSETDYQWLASQGFKSIVSFRRETGDTTGDVLSEGFRNYLWISVEDETNPTDEQAERFLDFVTDSQNWPILIHCKVGLGRTGAMAAIVRYAIDGWSMDEAINEARLYRGGVDLVPSQTAWLKDWASRHPRACHRPVSP